MHKRPFCPFFLEMFNSVPHDNILRYFIVPGHHLLIHSTNKTPMVDKRDITQLLVLVVSMYESSIQNLF